MTYHLLYDVYVLSFHWFYILLFLLQSSFLLFFYDNLFSFFFQMSDRQIDFIITQQNLSLYQTCAFALWNFTTSNITITWRSNKKEREWFKIFETKRKKRRTENVTSVLTSNILSVSLLSTLPSCHKESVSI